MSVATVMFKEVAILHIIIMRPEGIITLAISIILIYLTVICRFILEVIRTIITTDYFIVTTVVFMSRYLHRLVFVLECFLMDIIHFIGAVCNITTTTEFITGIMTISMKW